jgi:hypothetical protein
MSTIDFVFPSQAATNEMLASGVLNYLAGFENNKKDVTGELFNLILCNGDRSHQKNVD